MESTLRALDIAEEVLEASSAAVISAAEMRAARLKDTSAEVAARGAGGVQ